MTELTKSLTQLSTALFPNINSASDAVLAHQKELQRVIELKNKFNVPATEDIQLWFELFNAWNELKALELLDKPEDTAVMDDSMTEAACHGAAMTSKKVEEFLQTA